jgi:hypothetical protein
MYRIYVPHIDKTGGQSVELMLIEAAERNSWTYDHNAGSEFPDNAPDNYMRLGMHQEYDPRHISEDWFKLLIVRNPLHRFISAYNFFRYEIYRDTGEKIPLTVKEFCRLTLMKNGIGSFEVPALLREPRGYVTMIDALNAEQLTSGFKFTTENVFDVFDHVTDTDKIIKLDEIFEPLGLIVNTGVHVNYAGQHMDDDILTIETITDEEAEIIRKLPDFGRDVKLWSLYNANYK